MPNDLLNEISQDHKALYLTFYICYLKDKLQARFVQKNLKNTKEYQSEKQRTLGAR